MKDYSKDYPFKSGWSLGLFNVTTGDNCLRTQEYFDLIADLERLAEVEAALEHIAKQTEGYDPMSKIGLIHSRARAALTASAGDSNG